MNPQLPGDILVTLLRQCYSTPRCRQLTKCRPIHISSSLRCFSLSMTREQHDTATEPQESGTQASAKKNTKTVVEKTAVPSLNKTNPPPNIAILGGGITGLASAYYLSKELPAADITLYEASDRMGGWLQSKHVDVGNGNVVFEQGPRSLRPRTPAGLVTLELVKKLGLEDEMIITPKTSVAARNRFIYYPDRLVQMPGPGQGILSIMWRLFSEPIFKGVFSGLAVESNIPQRESSLDDESIGSFLQRRFGNPHIGDNLASAFMHGVYAGDIYQLSAKSLMPVPWLTEGRYGNFTVGLKRSAFDGVRDVQYEDAVLLSDLLRDPSNLAGGLEAVDSSVYSFKRGVGALTEALIAALKNSSKVHFNMGKRVEKLSFDNQNSNIQISTSDNAPSESYSQVISTISGRTLSKLTTPDAKLPSLSSTHAVTVMVVNLYYANPALLPVHGFGYLIPRSVPWTQNPERALGVVFDSDASVGQDTAPGTKVTVMLGGHWWDDWSSYPDEAEGVAMARAILQRHLNVEEEPVVVNVGLHKECIPQYTVGHEARMKKAHSELMSGFKGKLAVAGNSYTGVGLNDCVRAAKELVENISLRGAGGVTGLEKFTTESKWVLVRSPGLFQSRRRAE